MIPGVLAAILSLTSVHALALYGGTVDSEDLYPSTVYFQNMKEMPGGCSATKISAHRFVTAAHCVRDVYFPLNPVVKIGSQLLITNHHIARDGMAHKNFTWVTVSNIHIHPSIIDAFPDRLDPMTIIEFRDTLQDIMFFQPYAPDIAYFDVYEETQIPIANVSRTKVEQTDTQTLTAVGYGCRAPEDFKNPNARKNYHSLSLAPYKALLEQSGTAQIGGFQSPDIMELTFLSYGYGLSKQNTSLCGGDSGGGVYDADKNLVGVNSFAHTSRMVGGQQTKDILNQFVRVDNNKLYPIYDWLVLSD